MHRKTLCAIAWMALWVASTVRAEDWPRWRGPRGDGTWQGAVAEKWPAGGPRVVWKQDLGGGYAGVSAAEGLVVTMDRLAKPEEVERVLAWDLATGKPAWTASYAVKYGDLDYGNGPRAAPTIHDGKVYTLGAVGHFACHDLATGRRVWLKDLVREIGAERPTWGFAGSPVIVGELVVVHCGSKAKGALAAFRLSDGTLAWQGGNDPVGYGTPILVDHALGRQLVCWCPEHVISVDPKTGQTLWRTPYKVTYGVSIATPIFQEGLVLVAGYWEGSKAIRLGAKPTDATLAWEENLHLRGLMSQPLYRDGYCYLLDKGKGLTCFELKSAKKMWDDGHKLTPRGRNPQASLVWLGESDRAIALNSEGELILLRLNPKGYHEDSRAKIIDATWAHPAYVDRYCIARSDKQVVCVEIGEEGSGRK